MKLLFSTLAVSSALITANANAEALGFSYGRSANVSDYSQVSLEGALQVGETDIYGGRLTAKLANNLAVYGDLGFISLDERYADDGTTLGAGLAYEIEKLIPNLDTAINVSYHSASFDDRIDYDYSDFAIKGLISGNLAVEGASHPVTWYASAGLEFLSVEAKSCVNVFGNQGCIKSDDDDTELAFGGGVIAGLNKGEIYVGGEYVDGFSLAAGYRYNF